LYQRVLAAVLMSVLTLPLTAHARGQDVIVVNPDSRILVREETRSRVIKATEAFCHHSKTEAPGWPASESAVACPDNAAGGRDLVNVTG